LKIEPIKEEEIERAIKNLKPGKSPDIDGKKYFHWNRGKIQMIPADFILINYQIPGCSDAFSAYGEIKTKQ
jgi:hypothetical protein